MATFALKLLPLGDSITLGVGGGGYRNPLGSVLAQRGQPWDFVGPLWDSGNHAGYNGQTIAQIERNVPDAVGKHQPDVVLLQAGTNDLFYPPDDPQYPPGCNASVAMTRMLSLIDACLQAGSPGMRILLGGITQINATLCATYPSAPWHPPACPEDMPGNIDAFNAGMPGLLAANETLGKRVLWHDAPSFEDGDYFTWGIHLSESGYKKLATAWASAIAPLMPPPRLPRLPRNESHAASNAPNILLISTDQQRTSTLRCYGNAFAYSPNLDRLAAQGVRFTDAHTASPVCSPSRTSVLTGVHVPVHGIYENDGRDYRSGVTNYFDVLKAAGYRTAMIGKTHFSPVPSSIDHLDAHSGNTDMRGSDVSADNFLETYLVNQTMSWIDNQTRQAGAPWLAYLSMVSPHPPDWVPDGPWKHLYDDVSLPMLDYAPGDIGAIPEQTRMLLGLLGKEGGYLPAFPDGHANMTYIDQEVGATATGARKNYYALAAYVDMQVGRMLDFLDARRLAASTLVLFWSDHGSQLFDHGIANDKHNFYDGSLRVPLLVRWPGVVPANETRRFATTLDITATVAAVAGVSAPKDWQGFDLVAPLRAGRPSPRAVAVAVEYRGFALVTPSWKIAYFPEQDEGRLYDRRSDPLERADLFASQEHAATRDGLLRALLRWRAQQDPLGYLQLESKPGAATATEANNHTLHLTGQDAELRLQEDALRFEPVGA